MTTLAENYQKAIQLLTENQFREFVLIYNKLHYNATEGNITDGPYDGGIDLILRLNRRIRKLNIQVTVQVKGLDDKVIEDINKAAKNAERFEYIGTLFFFTNQPISNERQMKWVEEARKKQIELIVYDSKSLADITTSQKELRSFLRDVMDVLFPKDNTIDYTTRVLYDAISQQKGVNTVKESIIEGYIQQVVYETGPSTISQIIEKMSVYFPNLFSDNYYQTTLGKLVEKGVLLPVEGCKPKQYALSESQITYIESTRIKEQASQSELVSGFNSVCEHFGISLSFETVFDFVQKMYEDVYSVDIAQLSREKYSDKNLRDIHKSFVGYLKSQCSTPNHLIDFDLLANNFLSVFEKNDSLSRNSASKLFLGLFKNNRLDDYLASTKRELLLDTPVLIQYICCFFKDLPDYNYPPYQFVRSLKASINNVSSREQQGSQVKVFTLDGYLNEVVVHLCDAIQVGRFLARPEIRVLGTSKNSFYNFYEEVLRREEVGGIDEYIADILGIDDLSLKRSIMSEQISRSLEASLKTLQFGIRKRVDVENWGEYRKKYDFALLGTSGENKTNLARNNDLNAILYQSITSNEEGAFPYIVTWDNSFIPVRDAFQKDFENAGYWYISSPQQLASTLSLLDFKVNPEFITANILSVVEDTIAENADVKSLLDIVSEFLDGTGDSEMRIASRIASIKRSLYTADLESSGAGAEIPIDSLLGIALNQARTSTEKYEIFEALMSSDEDISGFIDLLSVNIKLSIEGGFSEDIFRRDFDNYLSGFEFV